MLRMLQMNDIMDQFDEIYKQFVELNDVIDQHVSTAIQYVVSTV